MKSTPLRPKLRAEVRDVTSEFSPRNLEFWEEKGGFKFGKTDVNPTQKELLLWGIPGVWRAENLLGPKHFKMYAKPGVNYNWQLEAYCFGDYKTEFSELTPAVEEIMDWLQGVAELLDPRVRDFRDKAWLLVTMYKEHAGVGPHDDMDYTSAKGIETVVSLSVGSPAVFSLQGPDGMVDIAVANGDVVMFPRGLRHSAGGQPGTRVNLSLRWAGEQSTDYPRLFWKTGPTTYHFRTVKTSQNAEEC